MYVYDYTSGQHPARRDRELPAAQVLGYAEEQGLQGGYQVTLSFLNLLPFLNPPGLPSFSGRAFLCPFAAFL